MRYSGVSVALTSSPFKSDLYVIGLVGLVHGSSHFAHLMLPLMFPFFVQEFALSYSALGLLLSVFFIVSGVGQAVAGFWVDRWGARPLLFSALFLFFVASVLIAYADGYVVLMVAAVIAGLANSTFHPIDFSVLNQRVSPQRLGYAFGAHGVSGYLGWAVAPVFFSFFTALWGWRHAFLMAALGYAVIFWLVLYHRDYFATPLARSHRASLDKVHALAFLKTPVLWWCFAFFLCASMAFAVLQAYSVPVFQAVYGVSFELGSMMLTLYMLCGAVGMLCGGYLTTRQWQSDRVVSVAMVGAAVLLALVATGWLGTTMTMVVFAATGLAVGVSGPSRDMMIKSVTPAEYSGRVYGMVYSGLDIGFAVSPLFFGLLMDRGWYSATLMGAAWVLAFSVVFSLRVGYALNRSSPANQ
jgi:MFS transporter, FSR family, fosmidomycin resistance protein